MDDNRKTKSQLIEELNSLRRLVSSTKRSHNLSKDDSIKLSIVNHAPFSMWACDRDFRIVFWNAGTSKVYGFNNEEVIGKNYLDLFVSDEERERSALDCLKIIDENYVQRNFLAYDKIAGGSTRALLTNCFRIMDENNNDYLQAEVALEVPELEPIIENHRTLRELGIKRSAELERILLLDQLGKVTTLISSSILGQEGPKQVFAGIINIVNDIIKSELISGIYLYDENKHNWSSNWLLEGSELLDPIANALGEYFIVKQNALFIDNEDDVPEGLSGFMKWWKSDSKLSVAALPLISTSKTIGVWLIAVPRPYNFQEETRESLRLIANQVAFAVSIARLIQNLKDLSEKVAEKQDLITRSLIAVDFVHRMNNLAGPIRGWTGLIREQVDPSIVRDKKILGYLDEIDNEVKGLLKAANALEHTPKPIEIDLNFMLSAMLRNVKIQYSSVIVEANFSPDLHRVKAIYSQLSDAIWNIISNAVDAMPLGGMLILNSKNVEYDSLKFAEITVSDTGPGIEEEHRNRIFDMNFTTKGSGRGYGLWRTKHIIEDIGGNITLTESGPATGTTFTLLIPIPI